MDVQAAAAGLLALASESDSRSKVAQLRSVITEVEAALAAGVKRQAIIAELEKHGLVMTLASFDSAMRRIRETRGTKSVRPAQAPIPPSSPPQPPHQNLESSDATSTADATSFQTPSGSENRNSMPSAVDSVLGSNPDLSQLAKHAKGAKK